MRLMTEENCEQSQVDPTLYVNHPGTTHHFHFVICQISNYTAIKTIAVRSERLHLNNKVQLTKQTQHTIYLPNEK